MAISITVNAGTNVGILIPSPCDDVDPAVSPDDLLITSICPLTDAQVGVAYSLTLTAIGGVIPYVWSLASGALPAGLTLSDDGVISGTPTGAEVATFTLEVTAGIGGTATKSCQMTVVLLSIVTTCPLTDANVGTAYDVTLAGAGGTLPYVWAISVGALPTGLSLNTATGEITGTPSGSAGVTSFTIRLTDNAARIVTKSCQITVTTFNALVYTNDFSEPATAHGSNDLGTKISVTTAFLFNPNRTACNISHDTDGQCLHVDFNGGNGHGGVSAAAHMDLAVAANYSLLEDSDQLTVATVTADNSVPGSLTRCGPAVFLTGTWNSDVPSCYYAVLHKDTNQVALHRIHGSDASETTIGALKSASIGDAIGISVKDGGTTVRVRLFVNGVKVDEVNDTSTDRINKPAGANSLGWLANFCSAPQYSKWTPLICVIPR